MSIARTAVPLTIQLPVGLSVDEGLEGKVAHAQSFAMTDSSDTTCAIYLGGLIPWRIINESGGAATFTFYDALLQDGTALAVQDADAAAIGTLAVADDESSELPIGLAGCTWLVITEAAGASGFTLVCKR
jgi:hypothetical protein